MAVSLREITTVTLARLRARLAKLRRLGPGGRRAETAAATEQLITVAQAVGQFSQSVRTVVQRAAERLIGIVVQDDSSQDQVDAILSQLARRVNQMVSDHLNQHSQQAGEQQINDWESFRTPEQKRATTGLNYDAKGNVVPPVVELPPNVRDDDTPLAEILLIAAPLLAVSGLTILKKAIPLLLHPLGKLVSRQSTQDRVSTPSRAVGGGDFQSAPWNEQMARVNQSLLKLRTSLQAIRQQADKATKARQAINETLGLGGEPGGFTANVALVVRSEVTRVNAEAQRELETIVPKHVLVGTQIHSRFIPTTRPTHAANDGKRWYRDERPGSAGPWESRLIAPYEINCVCFNTSIWEDEFSDEVRAEFGIKRIIIDRGGTRVPVDITIRDVGQWNSWFAQQLPPIQQRIVGDRRWFAWAANNTAGGQPTWYDFTDVDGRELTARELLDESPLARQTRVSRATRAGEQQTRLVRQAWEKYGRFWNVPDIEAKYRAQLGKTAKRLDE